MKRYLAFISYRHKHDDSEAALGFRKGIEGYHLPKGSGLPGRRRVFRDTDELPTSADLGADIENALRDSEYLIALCSEDYVKSLWCMREIEFWLELGRRDRILPVLVSGTPETSVPETIRDIPVAADLRRGGTGAGAGGGTGAGTGGSTAPVPVGALLYDRTKVKPAVPELLSLMSGMDAERIAGAERRFRMRAAAAAVACVTAGLLGFAAYASRTAARIADNNVRIAGAVEKTEEARKQAVEERNTALLRQAEYVSEQAWEALTLDDADRAIELALSVLPEDLTGDLPVSPEAEGVLRMALSMEVPPSYHFFRSAETDFDIRGYYAHKYVEDRLLLTGDSFGTSEHYVDYTGETGLLETDFSDSRRNAIGQGYTKLLYMPGDVNARRHYYIGPGRPLYAEGTKGYYHTDYTLEGEPFLADGAALDTDYGALVAWGRNSGNGETCTALFSGDTAEAKAVLEFTGVPEAVSFSSNASRFLLVDGAGTLFMFDNNGHKLSELDGGFTDVCYYYDSGSYACAASQDGTVRILDLEHFGEIMKIECPSPVRQVRICRIRNLLLARCDSGVYVFSLKNGGLITEIGDGATPNWAVFKNDRDTDGNMILLIYDRRVELYAIDMETDRTVTDYLPLHAGNVPLGGKMFYSRDGSRIFQHSYLGISPGEDRLYCWDARTGELLWDNVFPGKSYRSSCILSGDGRTVWRSCEGQTDLVLERVDGLTGETLLSARWKEMYGEALKGFPLESPDGTKAVILTQRSSTSYMNCSMVLLMFDTGTGELLARMDLGEDSAYWRSNQEAGDEALLKLRRNEDEELVKPRERTGFAEVLFSRDGKKLYCIQNAVKAGNGAADAAASDAGASGTGAAGICVDCLDTETGELSGEYFLETGRQTIIPWDEEEAVVLIDPLENEVNRADYSVYENGVWTAPAYKGTLEHIPVVHMVRILDLKNGTFTAELPFSYMKSPEAYAQTLTAVRSPEGGMALYWAAENADSDGEEFCCSLGKDGSTGAVREADSPEGRSLWVPGKNRILFGGEEAYLDSSGVRRMSDNALLLGGAWHYATKIVETGTALFRGTATIDLGIAAAQDGGSLCVYDPSASSRRTPFLILPSDLDTLVKKGKKRVAGAGQKK